jgi:hypothetical protein
MTRRLRPPLEASFAILAVALSGCLPRVKLEELRAPVRHAGISVSAVSPTSSSGYVFPYRFGLLPTGERALIIGVDGPISVAGRAVPTPPDSYRVLVLEPDGTFRYEQPSHCPQTFGPAFHSSAAHGVWLGCVVPAMPTQPDEPAPIGGTLTLSRIEPSNVRTMITARVEHIKELRAVLPLRDGSIFLAGQAREGGLGLARIDRAGTLFGETRLGPHERVSCGEKDEQCLSALREIKFPPSEEDTMACCRPKTRAASTTFVMTFDSE